LSGIRNKSKYLAVSILIGGKSSRFGSDKGLFKYDGKPLISHQIETLSHLSYDIFLVANSKNQVQDYVNIIDIKYITAFIIDENNRVPYLNSHTPMIGLYSASKELKSLGYKKTLVLACDNPFIQLKVIKFLIKESVGYDCCIPQWKNGYIEPLFAIYSIRKLYNKVIENLENNNLKLSNLLDNSWKINFLSIESAIKLKDTNLRTFININTPIDIENLKNIKRI
jgi:molybdopterin-guanine dinucleotide biosynthesis protein A